MAKSGAAGGPTSTGVFQMDVQFVNAHASPFIGWSESNLIPFVDTIRHATKHYPPLAYIAIQSTKYRQCIEKCAHGEYSEYPASTLVPRPDY